MKQMKGDFLLYHSKMTIVRKKKYKNMTFIHQENKHMKRKEKKIVESLYNKNEQEIHF